MPKSGLRSHMFEPDGKNMKSPLFTESPALKSLPACLLGQGVLSSGPAAPLPLITIKGLTAKQIAPARGIVGSPLAPAL